MIKFQKRNVLLFFITILIVILTKIFQYNFLPDKYFYDSTHLLNMINYNKISSDSSFSITAKVFKFINIFEFGTLAQWSIGIAIFFSLIIFVMYIRISSKEKLSIYDCCFWLASMVLLNIFVFNISKEVIQITIFTIILLIARNKKIKDRPKIFLIAIMFIIESIFFRSYYIIMAGIAIGVYFYLEINIDKKKKRNVLFVLGIIFLIVFIGMFVAKYIMPSEYEQAINVRSQVNSRREQSADAKTIITDLIENDGKLGIFMINYIINGIRMMIPLELLFKGYKYLPFVVYQLYVTYNLLKSIKNLNKKNIVIGSTLIAYFFGSFVFEPDFGSFVRHESTLFLLIFQMIISTRKKGIIINRGALRNGKK